MAPRFSVIMPVRDGEAYVAEAVRSVLAQRAGQFELLVVDNGSRDATLAEVQRAAAGDRRVRVLFAAEGRSGAARNQGVVQAHGRYLAFLDADDRWHPDFLARMGRHLDRLAPNVGGVFCRSAVIDGDGARHGRLAQVPVGPYHLERFLAWHCPPGNGSSLLLRREWLEGCAGFDPTATTAVDLDMWLRLLSGERGWVFWAVPDVLVEYRVHESSISARTGDRFATIERLLSRRTGALSVSAAARAWLRPALWAHRVGDGRFASAWTERATQAGWRPLLASSDGWRLGAWHLLGPARARRLRALVHLVRRSKRLWEARDAELGAASGASDRQPANRVPGDGRAPAPVAAV